MRVETVRKYATVSCNDPRQPNVRLNINGILRQVIKASPNALILKGPVGETLTGMFEVSMGTELGITVTEVTVNKNQADLHQIVELVEGEKYQIHLTAPPALVAGMTRDIVTVEVVCSDGEIRTTTVPLTLDHQSPITIVPRGNIVFQRKDTDRLSAPVYDSRAAVVKKDIQVFATAPGTRFNITSISIEDVPEGVFGVTQRVIRESERYVISVEVLQSRPERSIRGTLRIQTDLEGMPEVTARLYAQFAATPARGGATPRPTPKSKPAPSAKPSPSAKPWPELKTGPPQAGVQKPVPQKPVLQKPVPQKPV
ncbi:MAG: hypothetical protein OSB09_01795, partial [Planctomycetota bacterium]|nr:hypothetical protein [Planctomycetota bacterium]